jgi:nitrate/nitrite transport system permease protein
MKGGSIPGPGQTWDAAAILFADPFYRNGPNDQGIGWNVLSRCSASASVSASRRWSVFRSASSSAARQFLSAMINPIISLLRPVSPLAWLPIGLLVFKKADPAATYTIFICSIWPMIMNTAQGVQRVPQDYLNVARVLAIVGMEGRHQDPLPGRAALHADRYPPVHRHRLAGHRRR